MFKGHYFVGKWKGSIVNFRQYFKLKVGMFGQVGGRVWVGNQYPIEIEGEQTNIFIPNIPIFI